MSKWKENPGEQPVHDNARVDVYFMDGAVIRDELAGSLCWGSDVADDTIKWYRIVGESKMIDLKELYEAGHRRFLFSDGVEREVLEVEANGEPRFDMPDGSSLFFKSDGVNNLRMPEYPVIVGVPGECKPNLRRDDNGRWWLEVPESATVNDITKAAEVLNNG